MTAEKEGQVPSSVRLLKKKLIWQRPYASHRPIAGGVFDVYKFEVATCLSNLRRAVFLEIGKL